MMTGKDAEYYAQSMTDLQRAVLLLCSREKSLGYSVLAEKTGCTYAEVSVVGNFLQAANLATVRPIRHGNEYAGSAIFLNDRGLQVRAAAERTVSKRT